MCGMEVPFLEAMKVDEDGCREALCEALWVCDTADAAAKRLGISRISLYRAMKRLGVTRETPTANNGLTAKMMDYIRSVGGAVVAKDIAVELYGSDSRENQHRVFALLQNRRNQGI